MFGIYCEGGNFNITGGQVTAAGSTGGLAVCDYDGDYPTIPGILTLGCTNATDSITITGGIYNYSNDSIAGDVKIVDGIALTDDVTGYFSGTLSQDKIDSLTGTKTLTLARSKVYNGITFYSWKGKTALPTTAGNYYLAEDVELSTTWSVPTGMVNLDLNGHSIIITGPGTVISVPPNATLNMYDSGTGEHKYKIFSDIAYVNDSLTKDYKTFTGGYITGGHTSNGGGVLVNSGGTFKLYGGTIIGNYATNSNGGGVLVGGTFEMRGGSIIGNKASSGNGGGVYVAGGKFTMSGGRIIDNYAGNSGGGVYFSVPNTFIVSGTPVIKSNTVNGTANNVFIPSGNRIKWGVSLGTGAEIGVTMEKPLEDTIASADYTNYITSDNGNYEVAYEDGKLKLVPHTHSFTYTASGDTISATCTATNCALHTTPATLTIGKPAHETYGDEKAAAATITDANSIQGDATVVYYKAKSDGTRDGSALAEAPTDAGKYRAEITLGTGTGAKTAYVEYTVAKADYPETFEEEIDVTMTDTEITVTSPADNNGTYEYKTDNGSWQSSPSFRNLRPGKLYAVYARIAATDNYEASNTICADVWTDLAVTISGIPCKGNTLTANVTSTAEGTLSYQWYRGETEVTGAVSNKYFLGDSDVGQKISVKATLTVDSSVVTWGTAETPAITNCTHTNTELRGVVAATCTAGGYSGDKYCKDCGLKLETGHATAALGHDFGSGKVTTEATCTTAGVRTYTCSRCGETKTETIPALGHDYNTFRDNEIPATCTEKGSYDEVVMCSRCGKEIERTAHTIDALGHEFVNGKCIRCGAVDPDYKPDERVDDHKLYVLSGNELIGGADKMSDLFKLMKNKSAEYTVCVTENVYEKTFTFPSCAGITLTGIGTLTISGTIPKLTAKSDLTIDCAIKNSSGKAVSVSVPGGSALAITGNANVKFGTLSGAYNSSLTLFTDTKAESVSGFGNVKIVNGAALTVTDKMPGIDNLSGKVIFTGFKSTNTAKITNIGTADITLTTGSYKNTDSVTELTIGNIIGSLTITIVDNKGAPAALSKGFVVAKASSEADIVGRITITNTDSEGNKLKLKQSGKNIIVASDNDDDDDDDEQGIRVTNANGRSSYAPDLDSALKLITDANGSYTVELLENISVAKLPSFPKCAGITLTGSGTLTLEGSLAKITAKSSLTIDCSIVNAKNKAISFAVPAKATLTINGGAAVKLGTLSGTATSKLDVPTDLTVENISTFGTVTIADGAVLTVTKKLSGVGILNGSIVLANKSTGATIKTVGTSAITVPVTKTTSKTTLPKVTVTAITGGLTLNLVDSNGHPAEIDSGIVVAYAGTKSDITDKITLSAAGNFKLVQSDKEITAITEDAQPLLELDGIGYYKWSDMIKAMTDKNKDYTLRLLGDYDIGAAMKLPAHSKYKSLTIDGGGFTLTFVGTTVTLTNDTTLKNLTLTALNKSGTAVKYTLKKSKYNLTDENVNYGLGIVK